MIAGDNGMRLWMQVVVHLVVNSSDDASVGMPDDDRMNSNYGNLLLADKGCFSCVPAKG